MTSLDFKKLIFLIVEETEKVLEGDLGLDKGFIRQSRKSLKYSDLYSKNLAPRSSDDFEAEARVDKLTNRDFEKAFDLVKTVQPDKQIDYGSLVLATWAFYVDRQRKFTSWPDLFNMLKTRFGTIQHKRIFGMVLDLCKNRFIDFVENKVHS